MNRFFSLVSLLCLLTLSTWSRAAEPLHFSLNRLVDGKPQTVTQDSWDGKYLLMAVGYTTCPDICPTTMLDIRTALAELDKTPDIAKKVQPLFITIDPVSDSLESITQYAGFFDKRIIGLRASDFEHLDDIVEQLHASYGYEFDGKAVFPPNLPKGYTVMHSIYIYLYSPEGELLDVYPYNLNGVEMAKKIKTYIH